jgi:transposase
MKKPKRIDLNLDQVDALLKRVETGSLQEGDYEIIKAMVETIHLLSQSVDQKAASIRRLLRMLFGERTEKLKDVIKNKNESLNSETDSENTTDRSDKPKPKGHGRNAAADYSGAEQIKVPHTTLKIGDNCPGCLKGKLYEMKVPKLIVRVTGKAPLQASVYQMQKLRCNLCGDIFRAKTPEGIGEEKYDAASGAMIALLKYGSGLPFNRIEQLQGSLGVPLPASTQWEIADAVANKVAPAFDELIRQAAQGDVLHNDDTTIKILSLIKEQLNSEDDPERKGMFTSAILSQVDKGKIALFFTGRNHAGENLAHVLSKRQSGLDPPIQMCDALSRNLPKELKTILANCLTHARRNFVDVLTSFPEQCQFVIEILGKVYKNDQATKDRNLSAEKRLIYHQTHSQALMDELKDWFDDQLEEKKVEPNSGLGKAITYLQNHWPELTLFLRVPNAPLDNNLCEQVLKRAILHRKNSLFFKTERGAYVGDLFMSLIHTCGLAKVNPFNYLIALQECASQVYKNPQNWMPWNYKKAAQKTTA